MALSSQQRVLQIHALTNYGFGTKAARDSKPRTAERDAADYERLGMRRSVAGVCIVCEHNHPHILLLQGPSGFTLPGGRLRPGEEEIAGLMRKLSNKLAPVAALSVRNIHIVLL